MWSWKRSSNTLALVLILICGLLPRLALVSRFPTIPFSDFNALLEFGKHLHSNGIFSGGWFWEDLNPGLPLVLCALFHLFPSADPATVGRLATAIACGLLPLFPFLIWRGVLPLWIRVAAAAGLGLWPGQILFSGVVAQDNWVILPTVALACLAVRTLLRKDEEQPIVAGLIYAAAAAIRQEMVVALFPLFLAAARVGWPVRPRKMMVAGLALVLPLVCIAGYRYAATGRFALGSEHAGMSMLGAYIPGATLNGWVDPYPYIASVRPDLLRQRKALLSYTPRLAVQEALRRPGFHAVRIASTVLLMGVEGEAANVYWAVGAAEALPASLRQQADAFGARMDLLLRLELPLIQGLFLAALVFGLLRWNVPILLLTLSVALKYGLHAATVAQGRYFLPATALEILTVVLAAYVFVESTPAEKRGRLLAISLLAGGLLCVFSAMLAPRLAAAVRAGDTDQQRSYRFVLEPTKGGGAELGCVIDRGRLASLEWPPWSAALRTFDTDPVPGETADARCELTGSGTPQPLLLRILDSYPRGGLPDRMVQRVEVDGQEVFSHDVARDPGEGWAQIPLGLVGAGTRKKVIIEVKAIRPDPGAAWGNAAETKFQLTHPE
jgi:hypothetical protein